MSKLAFLSPDRSGPQARHASPLARALAAAPAGAPVRDASPLGVLEVRGDPERVPVETGEELVRITSGRCLLLVEGSPAAARERLRAAGLRVYELTAALAAIDVDGEQLLRRLTDLDLERLPATGAVARGVPALVLRRRGETFRLVVPQELAHYVAGVVLDLADGLAR